MKIDWRQAEARDAEILSTDGDSCTVLLGAGGGGISLPQIKGTKERYLTGDVEVLEEHSTAMMFRCFLPGQEKENLFMRFGILPQFKTRICLDLDLLDNRTIFTNRTPGTLKLVGTEEETIYNSFKELLENPEVYHSMSTASNPYGDGLASKRIADILQNGKTEI